MRKDRTSCWSSCSSFCRRSFCSRRESTPRGRSHVAPWLLRISSFLVTKKEASALASNAQPMKRPICRRSSATTVVPDRCIPIMMTGLVMSTYLCSKRSAVSPNPACSGPRDHSARDPSPEADSSSDPTSGNLTIVTAGWICGLTVDIAPTPEEALLCSPAGEESSQDRLPFRVGGEIRAGEMMLSEPHSSFLASSTSSDGNPRDCRVFWRPA